MNTQENEQDWYSEHGKIAQFVDYHWNEFRTLTPREVLAGVACVLGSLEIVIHRDDGIRVAKGLGKLAFGMVVGNTGSSRR